jgi:hypothetical protein
MEKIKRLEDVIVPPGAVLAEVLKPKRYIVAPDGTEDKDSYAVIIKVSPDIKDLEAGDIVIKYGGQMPGYTIGAGKSNERTFVIMFRMNINVAVKPDNFIDPDVLTAKVAI